MSQGYSSYPTDGARRHRKHRPSYPIAERGGGGGKEEVVDFPTSPFEKDERLTGKSHRYLHYSLPTWRLVGPDSDNDSSTAGSDRMRNVRREKKYSVYASNSAPRQDHRASEGGEGRSRKKRGKPRGKAERRGVSNKSSHSGWSANLESDYPSTHTATYHTSLSSSACSSPPRHDSDDDDDEEEEDGNNNNNRWRHTTYPSRDTSTTTPPPHDHHHAHSHSHRSTREKRDPLATFDDFSWDFPSVFRKEYRNERKDKKFKRNSAGDGWRRSASRRRRTTTTENNNKRRTRSKCMPITSVEKTGDEWDEDSLAHASSREESSSFPSSLFSSSSSSFSSSSYRNRHSKRPYLSKESYATKKKKEGKLHATGAADKEEEEEERRRKRRQEKKKEGEKKRKEEERKQKDDGGGGNKKGKGGRSMGGCDTSTPFPTVRSKNAAAPVAGASPHRHGHGLRSPPPSAPPPSISSSSDPLRSHVDPITSASTTPGFQTPFVPPPSTYNSFSSSALPSTSLPPPPPSFLSVVSTAPAAAAPRTTAGGGMPREQNDPKLEKTKHASSSASPLSPYFSSSSPPIHETIIIKKGKVKENDHRDCRTAYFPKEAKQRRTSENEQGQQQQQLAIKEEEESKGSNRIRAVETAVEEEKTRMRTTITATETTSPACSTMMMVNPTRQNTTNKKSNSVRGRVRVRLYGYRGACPLFPRDCPSSGKENERRKNAYPPASTSSPSSSSRGTAGEPGVVERALVYAVVHSTFDRAETRRTSWGSFLPSPRVAAGGGGEEEEEEEEAFWLRCGNPAEDGIVVSLMAERNLPSMSRMTMTTRAGPPPPLSTEDLSASSAGNAGEKKKNLSLNPFPAEYPYHKEKDSKLATCVLSVESLVRYHERKKWVPMVVRNTFCSASSAPTAEGAVVGGGGGGGGEVSYECGEVLVGLYTEDFGSTSFLFLDRTAGEEENENLGRKRRIEGEGDDDEKKNGGVSSRRRTRIMGAEEKDRNGSFRGWTGPTPHRSSFCNAVNAIPNPHREEEEEEEKRENCDHNNNRRAAGTGPTAAMPTVILSTSAWEDKLTEVIQQEARLYRQVHECLLTYAPEELHRADWWTGHYLQLPPSRWEKKRASWEHHSGVLFLPRQQQESLSYRRDSPGDPPASPIATEVNGRGRSTTSTTSRGGVFPTPIPQTSVSYPQKEKSARLVAPPSTTTTTPATMSRKSATTPTPMISSKRSFHPSSSEYASSTPKKGLEEEEWERHRTNPMSGTSHFSSSPSSQRAAPPAAAVAPPHKPRRVCLHIIVKNVHDLRDPAGRPLRPCQVPQCQVALASESRFHEAFTTTQPYRGEEHNGAYFNEKFTVILGELEERVCFAVTCRHSGHEDRNPHSTNPDNVGLGDRDGPSFPSHSSYYHTLLGETTLGYFQLTPDQPTPVSLLLVSQNPFPLSPFPSFVFPPEFSSSQSSCFSSHSGCYYSSSSPPRAPHNTYYSPNSITSDRRSNWGRREKRGGGEESSSTPPIYGAVSLTGVLELVVYSTYVSPLSNIVSSTEAALLHRRVLAYLWYHLPEELHQLHPILGRLQGMERGMEELSDAVRMMEYRRRRRREEKMQENNEERRRDGEGVTEVVPPSSSFFSFPRFPISTTWYGEGRRRAEEVEPCCFRLHLYEIQGLAGELAMGGRRGRREYVVEVQLGPFRYRTSTLQASATSALSGEAGWEKGSSSSTTTTAATTSEPTSISPGKTNPAGSGGIGGGGGEGGRATQDLREVVPIHETLDVWSYDPYWEPCTIIFFQLEDEDVIVPPPISSEAWLEEERRNYSSSPSLGGSKGKGNGPSSFSPCPSPPLRVVGSMGSSRVMVEKEVARVVFGFGRMIRGGGGMGGRKGNPTRRTLSLTHQALTPYAYLIPGEGLLLGVECLNDSFGWKEERRSSSPLLSSPSSIGYGRIGAETPDAAYWTRKVESFFTHGGGGGGKSSSSSTPSLQQAQKLRHFLHTAAYLVDCASPSWYGGDENAAAAASSSPSYSSLLFPLCSLLQPLIPQKTALGASAPRITAAPMTIQVLGIRNFRGKCACQVIVRWLPLPPGERIAHPENNNNHPNCPVILKTMENSTKDFLISFSERISPSAPPRPPSAQARAEHVDVAKIEVMVVRPGGRFGSPTVLGRVEVAFAGLWSGERNELWLPFYSETEIGALVDGPFSSSGGTRGGGGGEFSSESRSTKYNKQQYTSEKCLHRGFPKSTLPLGFVGLTLTSIAFPRVRNEEQKGSQSGGGGSRSTCIPFSSRRPRVGITLEEEVYRDVSTLLLRYHPSALPQLHPLITSSTLSSSLPQVHRAMRRRLVPYPVAATFYLFVDKVDLWTREGREAEQRGWVGIRASCGAEEIQCTRKEEEVLSSGKGRTEETNKKTKEGGSGGGERRTTRTFYPAIRIDVPLRPYKGDSSPSSPLKGEGGGRGESEMTPREGKRSASGTTREEADWGWDDARPAVLGTALVSAPLRVREDAVRSASRYPPSPFTGAGGGGGGGEMWGRCASSPLSSSSAKGRKRPLLPPPPKRRLPGAASAVPPLVLELIGLRCEGVDAEVPSHACEPHEGAGRGAGHALPPPPQTAGEAVAEAARRGDPLDDMNWLPTYEHGGGRRGGGAGHAFPPPYGRPLPPASYHRGPLGEACLSVRPFLTPSLYSLGEPVTVPMIATREVKGGRRGGEDGASSTTRSDGKGGASREIACGMEHPHKDNKVVPSHSVAVGQVGTVTFYIVPCAFDAEEEGQGGGGGYPPGVQMPPSLWGPRGRNRNRKGAREMPERKGEGGPGILYNPPPPPPLQGHFFSFSGDDEEDSSLRRDVEVVRYYEQRIRSRLEEVGAAHQAIFHYLFYEGHLTTAPWRDHLRHWLGRLTFPHHPA